MADTKTPSKSSQKTLDNINMVVGQISQSEELSSSNIDEINDKLGKTGLEEVILGIEKITDSLVVASNMLVAIAGYLFGEKGIGENTGFAQLTSKIKNTGPIFGETPIDEIAESKSKPGKNEGLLEVIITGVDGKTLESLVELIQQLNSNFAEDGAKAIESIAETFKLLSKVVEALNEVDLSKVNKPTYNKVVLLSQICETIAIAPGFNLKLPKDNIEETAKIIPALSKIIESLSSVSFDGIKSMSSNIETFSEIVNKIANLELKKFNKTYLDSIDRMSESMSKLFDIPIFKGGLDNKMIDNIKNTSKIIDELGTVTDSLLNLDLSKFDKKFLDKVIKFSEALKGIICSCEVAQKLIIINEEEDFSEIQDFTKEFNDNVIQPLLKLDFSQFTKDKTTNLEAFNKYVLSIVSTANILAKSIVFLEAVNDSAETINNYTKVLAEFISGNNGKGGLVMVMNRITKVIDSGVDLKKINDFFDDVSDVMKTVAKIGLLSMLASMFSKSINKSADILNDIIDATGKIKVKEIEANTESLHKFAAFMSDIGKIFLGVALCGIFAMPAIVGAIVIKLTAKMVIGSIQTVIDSINKITADKTNNESLKGFGKIMLVIGGIMLVAALLGGIMLKNAMNVLGFALLLAGFVFIVCGTLVLLAKFVNPEKLNAISQLKDIIVACSIVMVIGAIFMLTGLWKESLLFGVVLAAFIFMVMIPFTIMSVFFKKAIKGAKEISHLIVTCTLVMLLGALFMMIPGLWLKSLLFGAILTVFITMILVPFILFIKLGGRKALKAVDDIKQLVITCSIIMILGAFFMMIPGFGLNALLFAALVASFVFAIILPFAIFGKKITKAKGSLFAILGIILVSSIMIMIGASIVDKYGAEKPIIFAACVVGMVGLLAVVAYLLGKAGTDALKGVAVMGAISVICILAAVSLNIMGDAFKKFGEWQQVLIMVGIMCGMIIALGVMAIALGAMSMIPFFWAGIAAMAAIAGIALVFSVAMKNIGIAAKMIAEANKEGFSIDGAMAIVSGMITIGAAVAAAGAALPLGLIFSTSISCIAMAKMIDQIGLAVARISNLTVGTAWDSNGNATAFRQLDKKDFDAAAENTKTIISTLGTAIIELYEQKPEIFETPSAGGIAGFFGKKDKSLFDKVVQSCTGLGRMISLIAEGVANMANLTVATEWNSDGKAISFRTLKQKDFDLAASGTKTIISTLGNAICELYNEQQHLFKVPDVVVRVGFIKIRKSGSGPTIFEKVVTACTSMGQMISSIGKGVGDMADLKIADEWDKEGNPIHYRHLTSEDFAMAAFNTSLIVRTLGSALAKTYEENQEMFKTSLTFVDGKLQGDTPIIRVINAGQQMGQMVSSIAGGIQNIANLKMPTKWDKNGNAIEWREMTPEDFAEAGVKVGLITTVLSNALGDVYKKHPELFDPVTTMVKTKDGWFSDTYEAHTEDAPMVKVLKAAGGLGQFISENAEAVMKVADLKFEDKNGKKINIKISDLSKGGKVSKNIVAITTCLGWALSDAYFTGNYKDTMFNPEWVVYKQLPESVKLGMSIVEQCLTLIKTVEEKLGSSKKDTLLGNWSKTLKTIFEPFTDETKINDKSIKHIKEIGSSSFNGIDQLVTNVNKIDVAKADKFIELASELSHLSESLGNLEDFTEALNGKITETLGKLAEKLEFAANTIKESDKAQDKRQKLIDKNTSKLKDVMNIPMTIKLKKETSSSSGGSGKGGTSTSTSTSSESFSSQDYGTLGQLLTVVRQIKTQVCGG